MARFTSTRSKPYSLSRTPSPQVIEEIDQMFEELYAGGILETDIVDGDVLARLTADDTITGRWYFTGTGRLVLGQGIPLQGRNAGNTADINLLRLLTGTLSVGSTGSTDLANLLLQANALITLAAGGVTAVTASPTAITTELPLTASVATVEAFKVDAVGAYLRQAVHASNTLTPAALSAGSNNDYSPTDFATAFGVRLSGNATPSTVSGAVAPADGRLVIFWNISANPIDFTHEDTNSTAANRFLNGNGATRTLPTDGYIAYWYDTTSNRWREFAFSVGTIPTLASGTYTPTLTNVANLAASTAYQCQYLQVGASVTVSGKVDIDPTAAVTLTQLGISLPVASNIGAVEDVGGVAFASGIAGQGAAILGDAANNRAQLEYISADITNQPMYFTFTYQVI